MGDIGVNILANNSIISNNNFTNNSIGISIIGSNNNIISNLISENGIGIFSVNSNNTNINFNEIKSISSNISINMEKERIFEESPKSKKEQQTGHSGARVALPHLSWQVAYYAP